MCRQSDVIVNGSIINRPKVDHASTDFVVAAVNIDKGSGGGGGLIWRPNSGQIEVARFQNWVR